MININASDHGASTGINTQGALEAGTYPSKLVSAQIYKNNKWQSEEEVIQVTLVWDTGFTVEGDDGNDYPVNIYDAFLTFSFNEKANLTARLKALGFNITPETNAQMSIDGIQTLAELQHHKNGREARRTINEWTIDDETVFGREALVAITVNDKGWPKVTSVSAPVRTPAGGRKLKPRTATAAEAPEGMPL